MLAGQSTAEYVLIKAFIYTFSYLGLACLIYFYLALSIGGVLWISHPVSITIEVIGAVEILFYLVWFLPYRHYLHKQRPQFPEPLTREQRRELFDKSLHATGDLDLFVRKWMSGASIEDMRRENIKEWLLWALFDREGPPGDDDDELEEYVHAVEEKMGRKIKPGWGSAKSLRLNFDRFQVTHRALLYYLIIGVADLLTTTTLLLSGFTFYRQPRSTFPKTFPPRPSTLLSPKQSASPTLSYFHRPHKSTTHRPILLIHGIGIGLAIYLPLLLALPKDIGILALEILPISSHITAGLAPSPSLQRALTDIVAQQDLADFVLVANSYGTFLAKLFLTSPYLRRRTARMVLLDPVAVLLHLPDLAYNFTTRAPVWANEWQLWWVASTEPDVAFTLGRRFCWREHLVWREELEGRPTTLVLGGRDCIVDAHAIAAYVTTGGGHLGWTWRDEERWRGSLDGWKGEGLELVWLDGYDHGQGFLSRKMLPRIVEIIERYCEKGVGEEMSEDRGNAEIERREVETSSKTGVSLNVQRQTVA